MKNQTCRTVRVVDIMRSNGNLLSSKPPYRPQWRFKGVFAYPKHHDLERQHKTRPHHNQKHNPPPRQPHLPKLWAPQPRWPKPRNRPHRQHPWVALPPPHQPANTLHPMSQNKNTNRSPARTTKETRAQTPTASDTPRTKIKNENSISRVGEDPSPRRPRAPEGIGFAKLYGLEDSRSRCSGAR